MSTSDVAERRDVAGYEAEAPRRSLTGLGAVAVILVVALIGGVLDVLTGTGLRLGFAVALSLGTLAAAVLVRRKDLLYVVFAPPLVFLFGSVVELYFSGGSGVGRLTDAAAGWLVYGFPAIAAATGVAVVVAGVRVARKAG